MSYLEDNYLGEKQTDTNYYTENPLEFSLVIGIVERAIRDCLSKSNNPKYRTSTQAVSIHNTKDAYNWLMSDKMSERSFRWYLELLPINSDKFVRQVRKLIKLNWVDK